MMYLRSCPRCGGDLQDEGDKYGPYVACIQCGNHLSDLDEAELRGGLRRGHPSSAHERARRAAVPA